jgi:hypothetical protein
MECSAAQRLAVGRQRILVESLSGKRPAIKRGADVFKPLQNGNGMQQACEVPRKTFRIDEVICPHSPLL